MKVIRPSFTIESEVNGEKILKHLEKAGRTCYRSESSITEDSAATFIKNIINKGHETILEHISITVRIICNRAITHELVRHRLASYSQESSRWCNYSKDKFGNEITVVQPCFWNSNKTEDVLKYQAWLKLCKQSEKTYFELLSLGATAQEARDVLPNALKTEIVMTCNLREWRTVLKLRTAKAAHPAMREIMIPLLNRFQELIPVVFDDIVVEE